VSQLRHLDGPHYLLEQLDIKIAPIDVAYSLRSAVQKNFMSPSTFRGAATRTLMFPISESA
jgi:hypothetical protein